MTLDEFMNSINEEGPPAGANVFLQALWHDRNGDWDKAHDIADETGGPIGDWIHAYLHRKEGDEWNAKYWYRKADRPFPDHTLFEEWTELVKESFRIM